MDEDLQPIDGSIYLWAELRQAARAEAVIHLDDLLLRRVRLGLLIPNGGLDEMTRIRSIVQPELGWDDARWLLEEKNYTGLLNRAYRL
jgi:glycerol-3-phosphate dehydrogenase